MLDQNCDFACTAFNITILAVLLRGGAITEFAFGKVPNIRNLARKLVFWDV